MDLAELEWGDVLVDTGEVLVAQAQLGPDRVLVKRWGGGVLDHELVVRQRFATAGPATAELLGSGDGWMVLEDLDETMWRPAGATDLDDPTTVAALAGWFARAHAQDVDDLPPDPATGLLTAGVWELVGEQLPAPLRGLKAAVATWTRVLDAQPRAVVVDTFAPEGIHVLGAGLDAMVSDLAAVHRGAAASDLALARTVLRDEHGPAAWHAFQDGYHRAARTEVPPEAVDAAAGRRLALPVAAQALAGAEVVVPEQLAALLR